MGIRESIGNFGEGVFCCCRLIPIDWLGKHNRYEQEDLFAPHLIKQAARCTPCKAPLLRLLGAMISCGIALQSA